MEEPSYLLDTATTPRELMAVLGEAELCVAMRLHTLIFAARMAVPCIGLVYDPKVESYLQELDMPSAGHVERFDREEAIACADRMMADYEGNWVRPAAEVGGAGQSGPPKRGTAAGAAEADQGITRCPPSQGEAGTSAFWGWNNSFQKNGRLLLCRKNAG